MHGEMMMFTNTKYNFCKSDDVKVVVYFHHQVTVLHSYCTTNRNE